MILKMYFLNINQEIVHVGLRGTFWSKCKSNIELPILVGVLVDIDA